MLLRADRNRHDDANAKAMTQTQWAVTQTILPESSAHAGFLGTMTLMTPMTQVPG
jgi:hypothetical protein